jgi:hypothetical protein
MAVYFIQAGGDGPIKIGVAEDPRTRLRKLQCGNYETLYLIAQIPGSYEEEFSLHRRLESHRIRGEWFAPSEDVYRELADHYCYTGEEDL